MASTFKFGNGNWAVKDGSVLAYNDENNNFKPLPFDFTRDSIATRVNKDGLIEVVPNNMPRIDFTDNTSGHLLLEPSRTNSFPYSNFYGSGGLETFGTGTNSITVTNNYATSPDGSQNAMRMVATCGSTSSDRAGLRDALSMSAASATLSFYAKSNTSSSQTISVHFNGTNRQTITLTTEWQRFTYTATSVTTNNAGVEIRGGSTDTSVDVLLFGFQMEQASYATSYIPTEGSTVTRVVENTVNGGNSQTIGSSSGTVFIDVKDVQIPSGTANTDVMVIKNSSNINLGLYSLYVSPDGLIRLYYITGNTSVTLKSGDNRGQRLKIAFAYANSDFVTYVNGVKTFESSSISLQSGLDNVAVNASPNEGFTIVNEVKLYNTRLTDTELEKLTS